MLTLNFIMVFCVKFISTFTTSISAMEGILMFPLAALKLFHLLKCRTKIN